jgi:hypothetical protein
MNQTSCRSRMDRLTIRIEDNDNSNRERFSMQLTVPYQTELHGHGSERPDRLSLLSRRRLKSSLAMQRYLRSVYLVLHSHHLGSFLIPRKGFDEFCHLFSFPTRCRFRLSSMRPMAGLWGFSCPTNGNNGCAGESGLSLEGLSDTVLVLPGEAADTGDRNAGRCK